MKLLKSMANNRNIKKVKLTSIRSIFIFYFLIFSFKYQCLEKLFFSKVISFVSFKSTDHRRRMQHLSETVNHQDFFNFNSHSNTYVTFSSNGQTLASFKKQRFFETPLKAIKIATGAAYFSDLFIDWSIKRYTFLFTNKKEYFKNIFLYNSKTLNNINSVICR